jgi:hypothetical protein
MDSTWITKESTEAAEVLLELIAANVATINTHPKLVSTGYQVNAALATAQHKSQKSDDSKYLWLKLGDRERIGTGLTLCFCPLDAKEDESATGPLVDVALRVDIVCYIKGEQNPQKLFDALHGVKQSISSFLNAPERIVITLPGGIPAYMCRVFRRQDVYAVKDAIGEKIPAVLLSWRGQTTYQI